MNRELKAPIYLRITVRGEKVGMATGRWIKPNEWDTSKHRARGNSESNSLINSYLISTEAKILQIQNNFTVAGSANITAEYVKERLLGVSPEKKTLLQLFDYHNSQMKEQIGRGFREGTYKHYVVTYNKVKAFLRSYQVILP
jgi:Arm DNA-binding domain